MRRSRTARVAIRYSLGLGIVGAALLVAGCGQSRADFGDNLPSSATDGGTAGTSAGGSSGGNTAGHSGLSSAGNAANVGGDDGAAGARSDGGGTAGNGGGGGSSGGGSTGEAGADGADPLLGVECDNQRCLPGNVCVACPAPGGLEWLCVPHPVTEPAAHADATAQCLPRPVDYNECDGPEDCPPDDYCVARQGIDGGQRCRDAPSPASGSCCFTCGALPDCTLCRDDSDCPDGRTCAVVYENLKGCKPDLAIRGL
jgi:hypothetical protein